MSNEDPTKTGWTRVLTNGKQFLLLVSHSLCSSYIEVSPVKVLAVIDRRLTILKTDVVY
jgi:hypothetical protein